MAKKEEVSKQVKEELKEYTVLTVINLGSNKNGTPKKSYKPMDKITLSKKRAEVLLNQKKIK